MSISLKQGDQIGRNFAVWATFKGPGGFFGQNMACCMHFESL